MILCIVISQDNLNIYLVFLIYLLFPCFPHLSLVFLIYGTNQENGVEKKDFRFLPGTEHASFYICLFLWLKPLSNFVLLLLHTYLPYHHIHLIPFPFGILIFLNSSFAQWAKPSLMSKKLIAPWAAEWATETYLNVQLKQPKWFIIAVKATDSKLNEQQEHTTKPIRVTALQLSEQLNPCQKSN